MGKENQETEGLQFPSFSSEVFPSADWQYYITPQDPKTTPAGVPYNTDLTQEDVIKMHAGDIQKQLKALGYNLGTSGKNKDGVDGKWGNLSQKALDQALAEGYILKDYKLVKPQLRSRSAQSQHTDQDYLKKNAESIQKQLMRAGYNVGKTGADGKWGKSSQAALDKALAEGYVLKDGKLTNPNIRVAQPANPGVWGSVKNYVSSDIYDNMYPYNYGDVRNPDGTYRQVSGSDPIDTQVVAGWRKFTSGVEGMDPRRDLMNQMAALDLNTEEGMKAWKDLAAKADQLNLKMVRYKGTTPAQIKNQQWEMRARLDAMNLYQGRAQQWDTFIEQTDQSKLSGRATKAGRPTLIVADKNQRNRINGEILNYWNAHPEQRIKGKDGLYRMPFMSYLGNATIVQQPDGSLRYADDWDYTWTSDNDPNRPYFGEVLSDFSGNGYGTGVNSRSFNEGLEIGNIINEGGKQIKSGITGFLSKFIS